MEGKGSEAGVHTENRLALHRSDWSSHWETKAPRCLIFPLVTGRTPWQDVDELGRMGLRWEETRTNKAFVNGKLWPFHYPTNLGSHLDTGTGWVQKNSTLLWMCGFASYTLPNCAQGHHFLIT